MGGKLSDHEMARLTRVFDSVCVEATLTGAVGRDVILHVLLDRYSCEAGEEELKALLKKIIAERRGLVAGAKEKS